MYHTIWYFAFVEIARTLRRHDQDGWCRIFVLKTCNAIILVTTCNGCIVYVAYLRYIFFTWDGVAFMSRLFYSKCYVTIIIRELSRFSNHYLGEFLWGEEIVLNHFYSLKTLVFIFVCCPFVFESIVFWRDLFLFSLYFFCCQNDRVFVVFAIYFFFVVMKRHNRFFGKVVTFCYIPVGCSRTIVLVT